MPSGRGFCGVNHWVNGFVSFLILTCAAISVGLAGFTVGLNLTSPGVGVAGFSGVLQGLA